MSAENIKRARMRITVISPDEGVKKTDEHVLSDPLLETTVSGKRPEQRSRNNNRSERERCMA
jgi:hypothetical protein